MLRRGGREGKSGNDGSGKVRVSKSENVRTLEKVGKLTMPNWTGNPL
jgi:hypothetical protein